MNNLSASQKEEAESQKAYDELKAAKVEGIAAGQEQIDAKTAELADTDKNALTKQDVIGTKASKIRILRVGFLAPSCRNSNSVCGATCPLCRNSNSA